MPADPALDALDRTTCRLEGVAEAREVTGVSSPRRLLHAGPPLAPDELPGPMRGAVVGALLFEGEATDAAHAEKLLAAGEVELAPCHSMGGVGAMAGVVSPSMPVVVVTSSAGHTTFSPVNEGLGRALRFGTYDAATLERLEWLRRVALPVLARGIAGSPTIDLTELQAEALRRGDECHNRNVAATAALLLRLVPGMVRENGDRGEVAEVVRWASGNPHFFLPFSMASAKGISMAAHGVAASPIVTAIAANGVAMGIQVSGCGDRWFLGPAPLGAVHLFEGYTHEDAQPMMGDSFIAETVGLGALSLSASPAIGSFLGIDVESGRRTVDEMRALCAATSGRFLIPAEEFVGAPMGIDVRRVAATGRGPVVNNGVAHRLPGVGQVGAGLTQLPLEPFVEASAALGAEAGLIARAPRRSHPGDEADEACERQEEDHHA